MRALTNRQSVSSYRTMLTIFVIGTLTAAIAVFTPPSVAAQTWFDPADPDQPILGGAKSLGAVIWSHGRSFDSEDSTAPTPPYIVALRDGGWDTFRFNRVRATDTLASGALVLARKARELKLAGYQQVALAGQSFGGFLSLMAADASNDVDAVIATAPAAFGDYSRFYDSWRENATRLYPLLEKVRHARVMMFYFHGDDFDPGGRGEHSRKILAARRVDYVVIDQPRQLTGHWAASTPLFARVYGTCIRAFLGANRFKLENSCGADTDGTLLARTPVEPHQVVTAPSVLMQASSP